jgi:hypothetical protein
MNSSTPGRGRVFLFFKAPRSSLGPNQPPNQWTLRLCPPGSEAACSHLPLVEGNGHPLIVCAGRKVVPRSGRMTARKDPVPVIREAGSASSLLWTVQKKSPPPGFDPRTVQPVASRCRPTHPHVVPLHIPAWNVEGQRYPRFYLIKYVTSSQSHRKVSCP